MQRLGGLQGRGDVELRGKIIGSIDYDIDVWLNRNFRSATGTSSGENGVLYESFPLAKQFCIFKPAGRPDFLLLAW
jgi:hypothetical protein